ncbi:hypothetical protein EW145_g8561, partial [Phellinidium pouzarii]
MGLSSNNVRHTTRSARLAVKSAKCARTRQRNASTSASAFKLKPGSGSKSESESQSELSKAIPKEQTQPQIDRSASTKLLEDAAREEGEEEEEGGTAVRTHPLVARAIAEAEGENWTGEEPVRDAVLRMLVDK